MPRMTTEHTEKVPCGDAGSMDMFMWTPDAPVGSVLLLQEIFGVGAYIRAVAEHRDLHRVARLGT